MNAQQKIVEGKAAADRDDDLPVQNKLLRLQSTKDLDQFGEVPPQRLPRFRLQHDLASVTKNDGPKSVPLRFEEPLVTRRDRLETLRLHRGIGRADGKIEPR